MFREAHEEDLVPCIEEDNITTSEPEEKTTVHVISDEGEIVRPNENSENLSEFTYHKKDANTDQSEYDKVLNTLKKIDTSHNPKTTKTNKLVFEGNYKVTGDTRVITIVEHKDDKIQWTCSMSISTDDGEPGTLK